MDKPLFRRRFHLNKWYHTSYIILIIITSWNQVSYLSLIHWLFACVFIYFYGYKFMVKEQITYIRVITVGHLFYILLCMVVFTWFLFQTYGLDEETDQHFKEILKNFFDFHFTKTIFGYTSTFALLIEQLITYIFLTVLLLIMVPNFTLLDDIEEQPDSQNPEEEEKEPFNRSGEIQQRPTAQINLNQMLPNGFTFNQQKIAYERQQIIIERIMFLIVLFLIFNDGLVAFAMVCCMMVWLGIYYNAIDNQDRFRYQRYVTYILSLISLISLYLFLLPSLNYFQTNFQQEFLVLTGTLSLIRILKYTGVLFLMIILILSVRTYHYQTLVMEEFVIQIERTLDREKHMEDHSVSSIGLFLAQNYFGVIFLLSIFWITKQFSILRGIVFLLLLIGLLKRDRFKARKKWQTSKTIVYIATAQFILLLFYNVPAIFSHAFYVQIFHFIGLYELPIFDSEEKYAIYKFFWRRLNQISLDLIYILVLSWLIYSQQSLDDRRRQKIIDELTHQKHVPRNQQFEKSAWDNFSEKLAWFFGELKKSFLIHFDKLVILYCLNVSLNQADVFRAVFLLYFIIYAFVDIQDRKIYMRSHLTVTFIILFFLYTIELIFIQNLPLLSNYAQNVGLNDFNDAEPQKPFSFVFQFYDLLLGTLLINFQIQVIYKTDTLVRYKNQLNRLIESQEDPDVPIIQKQIILDAYNTLDALKKFFISEGLLFCQLSLLIVAFIPPANLISLLFICFFQVFLYFYYLYGSQRKVADTLMSSWAIMIALCIMILMFRFIYTIKFINYLVQLIFKEPTILTDLGVDPNFNKIKLIAYGILLQLMASYKRLYQSRLNELLQEYVEMVASEERKEVLDHRTWSYTWFSIKIRIAVIGVYHLQKVIFLFAFFIAVYQMSYIGILFSCLIFVILFNEMKNNWTEISLPLLVVLFLQIIIQYIFQATVFNKMMNGEETIKWVGIYDQYELQYWVLLILLHCCELLPLVYSLFHFQVEAIFKRYGITPTEREILQLHHISLILKELHKGYLEEKKKRELPPPPEDDEEEKVNEIIEEKDDTISLDRHLDEAKTVEERAKVLYEYLPTLPAVNQYREYLYVIPAFRALKFHRNVDRIFTQIGLELCLFMIVISAYYQRTFFSVFYLVIASVFANIQYKSGVQNLKVAWLIFLCLMMIEVVRKYGILQWTPSSWDIRKPWWFYGYSCDERGKGTFNEVDPNDNISDFMKCQSDWNYWLSLNGFTRTDIFINFVSFLLTLCFYRHFSTIQRYQENEHPQQNATITQNLSQNSDMSENNLQDKRDFTYSVNRRKVSDYLKFFVFCYFYKIALIVFLLIGMSSDISSYTEILSCLYFFIAINLLFLSSKLEKQKDRIWDQLILFNTIVMILMSLYQAPFIKQQITIFLYIILTYQYYYKLLFFIIFIRCPVIYDQGRYYYDNVECVIIQQTNHYYNTDFFIFLQDEFQLLSNKEEVNKYQNVSKSEILYMFISHLLGLNKTLAFKLGFSKETLMALFFLLGLLQRNIWQHPYTKKYVDPYFARLQQKQRLAAIQLVEGVHLKNVWKFKYSQAQKDCHASMQLRVSKRVQQWDEFFQFDADYKKKSFFYAQHIQNELNSRNDELKMFKFQEDQQMINSNVHSSFSSKDFQEMQKQDEDKIITAERLVQRNKAPIIQLYDACSAVQKSQDDQELLSLYIQELRLLEEKSVLIEIYLNERIGLFPYYQQIIDEMNLQIEQVNQRKLKKLEERRMQKALEMDQKVDSVSVLSIHEEQKDLNQMNISQQISQVDHGNDQRQEVEQQISEIHDDEQEEQKQMQPPAEHQSQQNAGSIILQQEQQIIQQQQVHSSHPQIQSVGVKQTTFKQIDEKPDQPKEAFWQSFKHGLKEILVSILTHDTYMRDSLIQKQEIDKKKISVLIFFFIAHYFVVVCILMMIINACYNANLIALFMPLTAFLYGMIDLQTKKFWNFMIIYMIIILSLKFIYQMPIFCDTPPYTFIGFSNSESCEPRVPTITEKISRIDYVIGIRKYNSAEGETFIKKIWFELLLFIVFLIQRYLLQTQGIWDFVRVGFDEYFIPQFKEKKNMKQLLEEEKQEDKKPNSEDSEYDDFSEKSKLLDKVEQEIDKDQDQDIKEVPQSQRLTFLQRLGQIQSAIIKFFYRAFPTFLPVIFIKHTWVKSHQQHQGFVFQSESAIQERPSSGGEWHVERKESIIFPEQIKTGRDFYVSQFVIMLILLIYFLIFYPTIISKRSYAHIHQGQSQRFSSEVIFVILIVITIMLLDRMLFIIRKVTKNPKEIDEILTNETPQSEDFSKYTLFIKGCMHVLLILVVHYYFFIVIPKKTNRRFQESPPLIIAYILCSFYFFVSALQLRYGYPVSEINQVFTQSSERLNSTAFQIYRAIPFLYELRIIVDWTFTTTSLDLIQWFKLEDIFATLYTCQAYMNQRFKTHLLGHKRKGSEKCCSGFLFALFLIFILILPILIFSSLNPAVEINNVTQGSMVIKASFLGEEDKLFFTLFQSNDIELLEIPNDQFKKIQKVYGEIESSWQERMQKVRVKRFSDVEWSLPENYRDQIRRMIKSQDYTVQIECEWAFQKADQRGGSMRFNGHNSVIAGDSFINNFGKILAPKSPDVQFDIHGLLPKFLYIGDQAETEILMLEPVNIRNSEQNYYQDIRLIHSKKNEQVFFELAPNDKSFDLKAIGANSSNKVEFFVLNELAFGSIIGAMSNNVSIIGIYATFVLAVGRFLRLTYDKISMRVTYEEMPETQELFDLCQSIYIARVDGNLRKEEIFYELLIRIYRSPEILFKMTGSSLYDRQAK